MTQALGAATWTDIDAARPQLLVVPLGSLEQHGPHLPLDTDTQIACAIAERAASRAPGCVVAPPLSFGASGEHAGFAGTLSIGSDVLASVVVELVRSAVPPFARVLLLNGHGGNATGVAAAVDLCRSEGRPVDVWSPRVPGGDAHAGRTETSLMLAIDPDRVRVSSMEPGASASLAELMPDLRRGGVAAVSSNGVLGDPTGASADEGETLMETLVDDVLGLMT